MQLYAYKFNTNITNRENYEKKYIMDIHGC